MKTNRVSHAGDCYWWSYQICDCGWLILEHSKSPPESVLEQWCIHAKNIEDRERTRAENANLTRIQQDQANVIVNLQNEINRCLEALGNPKDDLLTNVVRLKRESDEDNVRAEAHKANSIKYAYEAKQLRAERDQLRFECGQLDSHDKSIWNQLTHHKTLLEECRVALESCQNHLNQSYSGPLSMDPEWLCRHTLAHIKALEKE